jgi:hypothetical protein
LRIREIGADPLAGPTPPMLYVRDPVANALLVVEAN